VLLFKIREAYGPDFQRKMRLLPFSRQAKDATSVQTAPQGNIIVAPQYLRKGGEVDVSNDQSKESQPVGPWKE
jgi:hypothetical protein